MRRNLLGIVAAGLLLLGVVSMVSGQGGESARQFSGVCIRSGLVLGALWLALPQIISLIAKSPRWLMGWFVSQGKQAIQGKQALHAKQPTADRSPVERASPPPARRPRRRSNS